jgi:hypothetical protein
MKCPDRCGDPSGLISAREHSKSKGKQRPPVAQAVSPVDAITRLCGPAAWREYAEAREACRDIHPRVAGGRPRTPAELARLTSRRAALAAIRNPLYEAIKVPHAGATPRSNG